MAAASEPSPTTISPDDVRVGDLIETFAETRSGTRIQTKGIVDQLVQGRPWNRTGLIEGEPEQLIAFKLRGDTTVPVFVPEDEELSTGGWDGELPRLQNVVLIRRELPTTPGTIIASWDVTYLLDRVYLRGDGGWHKLTGFVSLLPHPVLVPDGKSLHIEVEPLSEAEVAEIFARPFKVLVDPTPVEEQDA